MLIERTQVSAAIIDVYVNWHGNEKFNKLCEEPKFVSWWVMFGGGIN